MIAPAESRLHAQSPAPAPVTGAGLGLRRAMLPAVLAAPDLHVDFMEVAPENWIGVGGRFGRQFNQLCERMPMVLHGLSLSLGSPAPLDIDLVQSIKGLMRQRGILRYTEHLSYCSDSGHLYDLLPIPFTGDAVRYVSQRIRQVQDILECRIGIENVSYYAALAPNEMSEREFLLAVLNEADCDLLLDVNNIYVNSINHRYDAHDFLAAMPTERIAYLHVAGHYQEAEDLIVDTHGADVVDPVWDLLASAFALHGAQPTLLERDFNLPPLAELCAEVDRVRQLQHASSARNR
jgi:uncharacterized protein (UPF0276 family)